jgi:hypothetical protein
MRFISKTRCVQSFEEDFAIFIIIFVPAFSAALASAVTAFSAASASAFAFAE